MATWPFPFSPVYFQRDGKIFPTCSWRHDFWSILPNLQLAKTASNVTHSHGIMSQKDHYSISQKSSKTSFEFGDAQIHRSSHFLLLFQGLPSSKRCSFYVLLTLLLPSVSNIPALSHECPHPPPWPCQGEDKDIAFASPKLRGYLSSLLKTWKHRCWISSVMETGCQSEKHTLSALISWGKYCFSRRNMKLGDPRNPGQEDA